MSSTVKKRKNKFVSILLVMFLISSAIAVYLLLNNKKATAVMECNVNPNIQFVLDQNNKVMQVNYLNQDAEAIFKEVNFNGKSADEAAQLFVKLCTEAGFIDVKTIGTKVEITLSSDNPENYTDLQEKITNKVDEYFDENGIIAGAVTKINTKLAEAVQKIGVKASELKNKTTKEIFNLYQEQSNYIKDIAVSLQSSLFEFIDDLKQTTFSLLDSWEATINQLEDRINNSNISAAQKSAAQKELDRVKKLYNENKNSFKKMVNDKIETLKQMSKEIFKQAKTELAKIKETVKTAIADYKIYYEQNKTEIDQKILNYRASLALVD